jgi:hypothetical protein
MFWMSHTLNSRVMANFVVESQKISDLVTYPWEIVPLVELFKGRMEGYQN